MSADGSRASSASFPPIASARTGAATSNKRDARLRREEEEWNFRDRLELSHAGLRVGVWLGRAVGRRVGGRVSIWAPPTREKRAAGGRERKTARHPQPPRRSEAMQTQPRARGVRPSPRPPVVSAAASAAVVSGRAWRSAAEWDPSIRETRHPRSAAATSNPSSILRDCARGMREMNVEMRGYADQYTGEVHGHPSPERKKAFSPPRRPERRQPVNERHKAQKLTPK